MAFTKYASLESAQVLDLKGSKERVRTASLSKIGEFEDYRTDDGFLYARIRAISSRVNKNHDGWPAVELAGGSELFDRHTSAEGGFTVEADAARDYGYSTFLGKPIFVDHNNHDPARARGVIVDSKLHVEDHKTASLDPYYSSDQVDAEHLPGTWVELLLEVDAKSFPRLAKAIIEGSKNPGKGIDGFSMGCDVEKSVCNICKNAATSPDDYCNHVRMKGAEFDFINPKTGSKESRKSYENCYGIKFFEISAVFDPADETALIKEVTAKTASEEDDFPQGPEDGDPAFFREPCRSCYGGGRDRINPAKYCADCMGTGKVLGGDDYAVTVGGDGASAPQNLEGTLPNVRVPMQPIQGKTAAWEITTPREAMAPGMAPNAPMNAGGSGTPSTAMPPLQNPAQTPAGQGPCATCGQPKPCACDLQNQQQQQPGQVPGAMPGAMPGVMPGVVGAKTADAPLPQADLIHAPELVDTLRNEIICPVCGSNMDEEKCDVCQYVKPPEGFDNPDLDKAKQNVEERGQERGEEDPAEGLPDGALGPDAPDAGEPPVIPQSVSHVKGMETSRVAATNPDEETPVITNAGPVSDEPTSQVVISDQAAPVTSSVRTASDFLVAAAGANRRTSMKHTADAASGAPAIATPDKRTDVEGVGGFMDASNEAASKADAQVDVLGTGGTGVESVDSDSSKSLPTDTSDNAGFDGKKNVESIPTKTFDDGSSAVERQADPVSGDPFPASEDGVKSSAWIVEGHDDSVWPNGGDGLSGGNAVEGVDPVDPVGKAQDRVNVLEHVTSPANNSGPTTQWTGTDGNGVLRQADPVTGDSIARGEVNGDNGANWTSSTHLFTAMKLADLEVELGLLNVDKKYERVAALEAKSRDALVAELGYAQRIKTAGLSKKAAAGVGRVPSLAQAPVAKEASIREDDIPDEALFS